VRQGAPRGVPLLQLENSKLGADKLNAEEQRAADQPPHQEAAPPQGLTRQEEPLPPGARST